VIFPLKMVIFHSYVSLPEATHWVPAMNGAEATYCWMISRRARRTTAWRSHSSILGEPRSWGDPGEFPPALDDFNIWGWVKTLVPFVHPKIAGIYGCSSH